MAGLRQGLRRKLPPLVRPPGGLTVASWNIAAINNNPFEYWVSHDDARYGKLMADFEAFIEAPGARDVPVGEVFTQYEELAQSMRSAGWTGLDDVSRIWESDYSNRRIISEFLKDKSLGSKRLASMPDRITNTINVSNSSQPVCRPTIINQYTGSLCSVKEWWPKWHAFMFQDALEVEMKGKVQTLQPCKMLGKISRAKYPAVTEEEEAISVPLQTLCMAIFDAILVHIMSQLSPDGHWQAIKKSMVEAMITQKDQRILDILQGACVDTDVICLQEVAASFEQKLKVALGSIYEIHIPFDSDAKRNQNSILLLRRASFPPENGALEEVTGEVKGFMVDAPVEAGDLVAVTVTDAAGRSFLLASFHGDTNGLATKAVVEAVLEVIKTRSPNSLLMFGMDANVYLNEKKGLQSVDDFLAFCKERGLRSCWPDGKPMAECLTTCNARTYVQPQFNKAIKSSEKLTKGDVNPKDHIIFHRHAFEPVEVFKDNTGARHYEEETCFPTLQFPSDHALVSATLKPSVAPRL